VERRWIIAPVEDKPIAGIAWPEICNLPCIAELLKRKNFTSTDEVNAFLEPRLNSLRDPFLLPNMAVAVARILRAVDNDERIVLFGDYDVDGVTSLALLAEMLRSYGSAPELFLPLRAEEGYGMSRESVDRCRDQHDPQLLIAVDCGTSSLAEIAELKRHGIDVIVLDHHEPKSALPDCVAVVNPKAEPGNEFHYLCSVGIVFKLCHALLKTRAAPEFDLKANLDLVALGTVADIVPLQDENRILVQRGAVEIARSRRPGIRKYVMENRPKIGCPQSARGNDILLRSRLQKLAASKPRHGRPMRDPDHDHNVEDTLRQKSHNRNDEKERRDRQHKRHMSFPRARP
jgi:single-stranded-DNA-specific exonuclease